MRGEKKSPKKTILKLAISGGLLTFIFWRVDTSELIPILRLLDFRYAILAPICIIIHYFVGGYRWKQLLTHEDAEDIELNYLINLYFIGSFFNNFMPTSVGGDVYKMYQLGKKVGSKGIGFSSAFMERFTGMISLVLISYYGLVRTLPFWVDLLPNEIQQNNLLTTLFKAGMFSGFWVAGAVGFLSLKFLSGKIVFFRKVYNSLMYYKDQRKELFYAFLTSFIIQALSIFPQYFIFLSLGMDVSFTYALFVLPVIALAGFFVPSINGLGVQDALYLSFFGVVGVSEPLALSASLLYHFSRLLVSLIGGVLYALGKGD